MLCTSCNFIQVATCTKISYKLQLVWCQNTSCNLYTIFCTGCNLYFSIMQFATCMIFLYRLQLVWNCNLYTTYKIKRNKVSFEVDVFYAKDNTIINEFIFYSYILFQGYLFSRQFWAVLSWKDFEKKSVFIKLIIKVTFLFQIHFKYIELDEGRVLWLYSVQ